MSCATARTCTDISTNADIIEKLKNDLKLVKLYVNARDRGHCTKHLAFDNTVVKTNCVQCLAEDVGEEEEEEVASISVEVPNDGMNELIVIHDSDDNEQSHDISVTNNNSTDLDQSESKDDNSMGTMDDSAYGGVESCRRTSTGEKCLRDVVMAELGSLIVKTLVAIAKSKNLNVETILEKS